VLCWVVTQRGTGNVLKDRWLELCWVVTQRGTGNVLKDRWLSRVMPVVTLRGTGNVLKDRWLSRVMLGCKATWYGECSKGQMAK
jgi:hypothetical protein